MYTTTDFAELYHAVTRHIASAIVTVQAQQGTYSMPVGWLTYLTFAFEQQFGDWQSDPRLAGYLNGLETWRGKRVHPAIRLAGHVYLHIGYDLPRSVGVTLGADMGAMHVPSGSPALSQPAPVTVAPTDRVAARMLFLQATPAFEAALTSSDGRKVLRRAGFPMAWLRLFGAQRQQAALEVLAQWAIALRGIAWMHAEILADVPTTSMQQQHVERLLDTMQEAQDAITQRTRLLDVRLFRAPHLLQVAPLTLLSDGWMMTVAVMVVLAASLALAAHGRRQRIAAAIDALGRETYRRLAELALPSPDSAASYRAALS
ncbi:MAG: hypothetical protein ABI920_12970 [Casimicrobiaceae bacterium]